jgi:hypothetical protein
MPKKADKKKAKRGPKPEVLKIEGNWIAAVDRAMAAKKPSGGWPKPSKR